MSVRFMRMYNFIYGIFLYNIHFFMCIITIILNFSKKKSEENFLVFEYRKEDHHKIGLFY